MLPVVALLNGWVASERWPLRTLRVQGSLHNVDEQLLRATVLPYAKRGFFAVPLEQAQEAVARLPWVERAEVRKHWPDVLEVRVVEHRPFARWGNDQLLSEHGRLFPVNGIRVPAKLPTLGGPATRVHDVVALYNESRALFASTGRDVRALRLDARGRITTQQGDLLQPAVTLPAGTKESDVQIGSDGTISVANRQVGRIQLMTVRSPQGLQSAGDNLFRATTASGAATALPGGRLTQGAVEASNVDVADTMTEMMDAQRSYQLASKAIQMQDQLLQIANSVKS